jgi:hypothetical protein
MMRPVGMSDTRYAQAVSLLVWSASIPTLAQVVPDGLLSGESAETPPEEGEDK